MLIHLHKQATTTPKVRAAIQASDEPASTLAERFGTTEQTVYKWKHRDSVHDRSHTPYRLQTTLTPAQEAVAVVLRKTLLVSIDDLLAVVREFLNPEVSRSGLDRCLRRHGVGNLRDLQAQSPRPKHKAFRAYEPGYLHVDVKYLPQMADETSRRYLFVAIDRATRWVFVRIYKSKTAANARRFLRDLERACPMRIRTILTDNGKEFTDRLFGLRKRSPTGKHEFDLLCADLGIEHRLAPPQHPQTNGMVERFNGRIEEVLQSHHFHSGEDLETTLHRYALLYNQQLPQSALGSKTPLQAMKDWHKMKPELFRKQPYHLPGCDSYTGYESHEHGKYALPKVSAGGQSYSGFNMGAGESAVFEILAALFAAGPGCLLVIDELELGLHERAQARLIDELKTLCKAHKCQIICTTHSHAILAALPPEGRVFVDNIGGNTLLYPEISSDFACGKMGGKNVSELDIFVEDEVAKAILLKALDAELRARTRVLPIGSHGSLKRLMAARYMEGRRNCLCFLDGDQHSTHEAAKSAVANNCDGRFDAQKEEIKAWADARLAYLPGDTWPEKWVFEQAIRYCTIPGMLCPSPDAGWGLPEAQLLGMLQSALAAGKHNEFYTLAKDLNLPAEQVRSDLLSALKQCNAQPFEGIKTQIQHLLA